MRDLKKVETSLEKLHKDFNIQLNALGDNSSEFHNAMIELVAKYPDHKELIQFIVHINDKLETNHTLFSEIVIESFNKLIEVKMDYVREIIERENTKEESFFRRTLSYATNIKDIKIILLYITLVIALSGAIFAPDTSMLILKTIAKLIN